MGVGILPQLSGNTSSLLTGLAVAGFVCNALGAFLGHLFSADAAALKVVKEQVQANTDSLLSGDTTMLRKAQTSDPAKV